MNSGARTYAIGFYGGIGERASIAAAHRHGQAALRLEGRDNVVIPPPKVRRGVDASRLVLAVANRASIARR